MKNDKKKRIIILVTIFTIILFLGATYAIVVDYLSKTGKNSSLVVGDIYMHYNEGSKQISLSNAMPSNTYSSDYFEFTVDGKNTSNKNINYLISLSYGDTPSNRTTRIKDNLLDFKLVSVDNNTETVLIDNINFNSLNNAKLYTESVSGNTNNYLKTYRLYMKISYNTVIGNVGQDYTIDEWNDVFASVKVNVLGTTNILVTDIPTFKEMVLTEKSNTYIKEDNTVYLSGSSDDINYNYVWYSGKLWRITAINEDGTMKMITDDAITTISYGADVKFYDISKKDDATYTGSYIYQWLNEDFLDTLYNHENIIVMDSTWNITNSNASSSDEISTKLQKTTLINNSTIGKTTPVGLLNSYEYYLSYKNANSSSGYLNIDYFYWLLNPYSSSNVWVVLNYGNGSRNPSSSFGARPSINLKSNIQLTGGSGTKDNPYKIAGDKEDVTPNTTYLNTRSIGEYVIFDEDGSSQTSELYRIVSIEDGKIKLNKNDYIKNGTTTVTKKFATSTYKSTYGNGTTDDCWDYYLNNTWYNSLANKDMLESSTYYIKERESGSYKNSLCSTNNTTVTTKNCTKTTSVWTGLVGLPRYGEMFASQQGNGWDSSKTIWLITPHDSSLVWLISNTSGGVGDGNLNDPSYSYAARPSINLKSNIVITGGDGTKNNPFTIALKAK